MSIARWSIQAQPLDRDRQSTPAVIEGSSGGSRRSSKAARTKTTARVEGPSGRGTYRYEMVRGAVAGAVAAAVWVAAEPLGQRVFRTPYSIVRLLGALLTARAPWRRVGIAVHLANGAFFGAIFGRMGRLACGRSGSAEVEFVSSAVAAGRRIHPDQVARHSRQTSRISPTEAGVPRRLCSPPHLLDRTARRTPTDLTSRRVSSADEGDPCMR